MREKTIKGWIVIDWKEGTHRTRKSKPGSLGTNELLAKLFPEPQVHAATLEALDDEELPDWTDTANEIVSDHADQFRSVDRTDQFRSVDRTDMRGLVDQLTTQVLVEVNTRPDPERVREYIRRTAQRVVGGDE